MTDTKWTRVTEIDDVTGDRVTSHHATISGVPVAIYRTNSKYGVWPEGIPSFIARDVQFGFAPYWFFTTLREAKAHAEARVPAAVLAANSPVHPAVRRPG